MVLEPSPSDVQGVIGLRLGSFQQLGLALPILAARNDSVSGVGGGPEMWQIISTWTRLAKSLGYV